MDENFIKERLTELIISANISESKMSKDLGYNRGYIRSITSGNALPHMKAFLKICEYLQVSPAEFFNVEAEKSVLLSQTIEDFNQLNTENKLVLREVIRKLKRST